MAILSSERQQVLHVFDDMKTMLPVTKTMMEEYQITKSYALSRPTFGQCGIALNDPQFTGFILYYFPEDWKWGHPLELLKRHFWLKQVGVKDPVPCLTKAPHFGGMGIYTILGDDAITERVSFRKSRLLGYRFKAEGRDATRKALVARINADQRVLTNLHQEFACGKGRPLPAFDHMTKALIPFGDFEITNLEQHQAKITDRDLWSPDDATLMARLTRRLSALRPLAIYLQGQTPPATRQSPPTPLTQVASRFCTHCGIQISVDAVFCGQCGQKLVP